jgi:hypothetical protein
VTAPTTYANPYWDVLSEFAREQARHPWDQGMFVGGYDTPRDREAALSRHDLTSRFAWTVTDPDTVAFVVEHAGPRVIDPLAGSGYWAWLLRQHGADVAASDLNPPGENTKNQWHRGETTHTEVVAADAVDAVTVLGDDRVLLLSWPPYDDPIGANALAAYLGPRVIYIGEGESGCCGDDDMCSAIRTGWHEVAEHRPVQWYGMHDYVTVYERGAAS